MALGLAWHCFCMRCENVSLPFSDKETKISKPTTTATVLLLCLPGCFSFFLPLNKFVSTFFIIYIFRIWHSTHTPTTWFCMYARHFPTVVSPVEQLCDAFWFCYTNERTTRPTFSRKSVLLKAINHLWPSRWNHLIWYNAIRKITAFFIVPMDRWFDAMSRKIVEIFYDGIKFEWFIFVVKTKIIFKK